MAGIGITVTINRRDLARVQSLLRRIDPSNNVRIMRRFLRKAALKIQSNATTKQILRGGSGPPHPTRVTSRTGTLRRSIKVNLSGAPDFATVGSDLVYAPVHELGSLDGRTRKRPYLKPALEEEAKGFDELLAREIRREIER